MIVEEWTTLSDGTPTVEVSSRQAVLALDVAELLPLFAYAHLPPKLQEISAPFGVLAEQAVAQAPAPSLQLVHALTWLLKAKDAAVRAALVPPARIVRADLEGPGGSGAAG